MLWGWGGGEGEEGDDDGDGGGDDGHDLEIWVRSRLLMLTTELQDDVAIFHFFQIFHIFSAMNKWRLQFILKCWCFIEMGKSSIFDNCF